MTNLDLPDVSSVPQPDTATHRVYSYAVQRVTIDVSTCADDLDLTLLQVHSAIGDLVKLRLLQVTGGERGQFVVVDPASASLQLLSPYDEELRARQLAVEQVRQQIHSLLPLYRAGTSDGSRSSGIERIDDLDAVRGVLGRLADECQSELITSQPGGARSPEILEETARRDSLILQRGVRMRTLYQHTARFDQPTRDYVTRIIDNGAEVRTSGSAFTRAIVYDRAIAVITLPDNPKGAALIRDPNVVQFVVQSFEYAWAISEPFNPEFDPREIRSISDSLNDAVLRMLVSGHDDKSIARQLGISPRTCQRRISDVMQRIGARTRLQAGYLIRHNGLVPLVESEEDGMLHGTPDGIPGGTTTTPATP
ncbi:LuxR C-terminal-related transcriptional regulator [Streptomyces sp. NPDC096339]|uniref:LuxR C-terminal-related transcriptional regulator n=1 Tax=Streptomyces sp. NPDC096339 TaxID=3366086 RepID=UPI00381D7145